MHRPAIRHRTLVMAAVLGLALSLLGIAPQAHAFGGSVSSRQPDGLVLSTGNVYFTSHDASSATVWRTGRTSQHGQEIALYVEPGGRFGDIVFAQVNGVWFGYFFDQRPGGVVTIKRVPLAGGPAVDLAFSPPVSNIDVASTHHNLVTDGTTLYWQEVDSVRKGPIGGGVVTILDQTTPQTPTAGIALQGTDRIVYASTTAIRFVPTAGTTTSPQSRTIVQATDRVTTLAAVSNGVYWGELGGAVRDIADGVVSTLKAGPGPVPTSISTNGVVTGGGVVWTACGPSTCQLRAMNSAIGDATLGLVGTGALGAITSDGHPWWGDSSGIYND
jgi:hypothetical protein